MYTILLYENEEWKICFDGNVPILGDMYRVIENLSTLRLSNPEALYKIAKVEIL